MNNSPSSVNIVMVMVISLKTTRRKPRKNLKNKRVNSGHKPENQAHPNRPIERK